MISRSRYSPLLSRATIGLVFLSIVVLCLAATTVVVFAAAAQSPGPVNVNVEPDTPGQLEAAGLGVFGSILGGIIGYIGARRVESIKTQNQVFDDLEEAAFAYSDELVAELDTADPLKKLRARAHTDRAAGVILRLTRQVKRADIQKLINDLIRLRTEVRQIDSSIEQAMYVQDHLPPLLDGLLDLLRGQYAEEAA